MKEIIFKTNIKKEPGYLYYVGYSEEGCLQIGKAKMEHRGRGKKQ